MNRLILLSCFAIVTSSAAELVVQDVRLGLTTRPGDVDFTLQTSTVDREGSDAFDGGLSLEGGLRWSFAGTGDSFGVVLGADLAADGQTYDGGDGLVTGWAKASAGVGWAVNDQLTVLGEGLVGFGVSSLTLPATAASEEFTADGTAVAYEFRLTGTWQFTRGFNAGLIAGWLIAEHDLSGDDSDMTLEQSGWYAGLVLGWRIDDVPQTLE